MLSDKEHIMDIILNGIYNFLSFIYTHWTMICAIIVLATAIYHKVVAFMSKSKEERLNIAKAQIRVVMLRLVTEAENDYASWIAAGAVKRSQVIDQVFAMYPILSKISNQDEIIAWLDDVIDEALDSMREIFEKNKSTGSVEK